MSFSVSPKVNYEEFQIERCIHPRYKCNCTKQWKYENRFMLFECIGLEQRKVIDDKCNFSLNIQKAISVIEKNLTNKCLIAGGHTVVNLKDRFKVGQEAIKSVKMAFLLIDQLRENRQIDFLIPLNDFYMEQDDNNTIFGKENSYRKKAYNPYITPPIIRNIADFYEKKWEENVDIFYCSEKNMADKFKRHIKNHKKVDSNLFFSSNNEHDWNIKIGDYSFPVIVNNKPNCAAGNAATLREIRYLIYSNKIKDNYTSHVGIYPLCSMKNVLDGYLAASVFYKIRLPTYFIFTGTSCFL